MTLFIGSASNFVDHPVNFHFTPPFATAKPIHEPVFTSAFNNQGLVSLGNNFDFHARQKPEFISYILGYRDLPFACYARHINLPYQYYFDRIVIPGK
jgi:hypothetical protein